MVVECVHMNEDKIIMAVLDLGERIKQIQEEMMTKADGRRIQDVLEGHTTIMKNIQEDHTFAIEWVKRLQDRVDEQEKEIKYLKLQLKLA